MGGGDGGVIREVSKHPAVESIAQCEIDVVSTNGLQKYGLQKCSFCVDVTGQI